MRPKEKYLLQANAEALGTTVSVLARGYLAPLMMQPIGKKEKQGGR